ncbi:MAG: LPP20 family lipoprotein [Candidatus Marinimicrobia bacterium]|nr:LPP20 family lipoprotein [Candidatus Neomarinimicrobiota bacterium]MBL7023731.1 LPP20 family lipoprotein [Candidatus Neomarinimicrobiota bacterium]MBL7109512.1 LPP20 family lipoprotein [Candidatus Neomarinimicrobiota bacterium]
MKNILLVWILLLFGCATTPEPAPIWVSTFPQSDLYWFGIGSVQKPFSGDMRENARNKALNEISSQIQIQITSTFSNIISEHNLNIDQYTRSVIESRMKQNLPSVEFVEIYETENQYSVLARLSREKYYKAIEEKRRNAVTTSINFIQRADAKFNKETFHYLSRAFTEIENYLDVPIEIQYPPNSGNIVNLYSLIKLKLSDYASRIELIPVTKEISAKIGIIDEQKITINCLDKLSGNSIPNIPIFIKMDGNRYTDFVVSDVSGKCEVFIHQITNKTPVQYLDATIDKDKLLGKDNAFYSILNNFVITQVTVNAMGPNIFVDISEKLLNQISENQFVTPVIKEYFASEYGAVFTNKFQSDFQVIGNVTTRKLSNTPSEYGIFQVFADATITIVDTKTGNEVFSKGINKVQGSAFSSNLEAGNSALKKLANQIKKKYLPEITSALQED